MTDPHDALREAAWIAVNALVGCSCYSKLDGEKRCVWCMSKSSHPDECPDTKRWQAMDALRAALTAAAPPLPETTPAMPAALMEALDRWMSTWGAGRDPKAAARGLYLAVHDYRRANANDDHTARARGAENTDSSGRAADGQGEGRLSQDVGVHGLRHLAGPRSESTTEKPGEPGSIPGSPASPPRSAARGPSGLAWECTHVDAPERVLCAFNNEEDARAWAKRYGSKSYLVRAAQPSATAPGVGPSVLVSDLEKALIQHGQFDKDMRDFTVDGDAIRELCARARHGGAK